MKTKEKLFRRRLVATRKRIRERVINVKKLIDPWSVPHFLFGVLGAFVAVVFSLPLLETFFGILVLAMLWELIEKYFRLSEPLGNAWVDVLLPLIAFTATLFLLDRMDLSETDGRALLVVSVLLYVFVNFFAWRARFEHDRDFWG